MSEPGTRGPLPDFATADLCDAHESDVRVMTPGLVRFGGLARFCGEAVTVKCFEDNQLVKEALAKPGAGKVLVVDGGGSMRRALMGDLIAKSAVEHGWSGVVIDGCIRDSAVIATLPLGVRARGTHPLKTEKRGVGDVNVPVVIAGVTIAPGDFVYADEDGVVVAARALV